MIKNFIILLIVIILFNYKIYAIIINEEKPVYYFVNHKTQITNLKEKLLVEKVVGITGITGMGKSELVRKYVQEYKNDYDIIVFLDASVDLIPQFMLIAKEINQQLCVKEGCSILEDNKNVKKSLMEYLKPRDKWLLIFDNLHINENEKIKDIIDWRHNGHIIICSQDSKYLLHKISIPYLKDEHAITVINKIMKDPSIEFVEELVKTLKGYPTYMIGHSAIFLQNNDHIKIREYINYMGKHDNKVRTHLNITLKEITPQGKDLLYKMALLNNQRIPRYLLKQLTDHKKENFPDLINELIRFGLIEHIAEDRNRQTFRMHNAVKEELLNIIGNKLNQQNINSLLDKFNNIIPNKVSDRLSIIRNSRFLESSLEILLNNADKYDANIHKIIELRKKLLWYYLIGQRQSDNAKKMVDWFKNNALNINLWFCTDQEKASYSTYLTFIGVYEGAKYSITNHHTMKMIMYYLNRAQKIAKCLSGYEELKSYIYSIKALMQITVGDIKNAKKNIQKADEVRPTILKTFLGAGLVEYNKAKILIIEGKYQEALNMLLIGIDKTVSPKNSLHLAPEYITQATILNYMHRFKEAYDILNNNIYSYIKNKKKEEILLDIYIVSQTLTELSRAELGLGRKKEALRHAIKAVNFLIEDEARNNKEDDLDNSTDVVLADALVVKANALNAINKPKEAMSTYKVAKNIYWNIYGIKNIGHMGNVSYLFTKAAKAAKNLPDLEDSHIQCVYFYTLLLKYFGAEHSRSKEINGVCY